MASMEPPFAATIITVLPVLSVSLMLPPFARINFMDFDGASLSRCHHHGVAIPFLVVHATAVGQDELCSINGALH